MYAPVSMAEGLVRCLRDADAARADYPPLWRTRLLCIYATADVLMERRAYHYEDWEPLLQMVVKMLFDSREEKRRMLSRGLQPGKPFDRLGITLVTVEGYLNTITNSLKEGLGDDKQSRA